jgi:hypothetical protein
MTEARKLSRNETHDLGMIIKDRAKVLKAHIEAEKATVLADFEKQIAAVYEFDQDEVWKAATEKALEIVREAQEAIAKRCEELGIPKTFAPSLHASWQGRGENMLKERRNELRRVAKAEVDAMAARAVVKVERDSLDLRTQVVAMGLLSPEATTFLNTLKPVEEVMHRLDFANVEKKLAVESASRKHLGYSNNRFDA